jgi:hypothetical protein
MTWWTAPPDAEKTRLETIIDALQAMLKRQQEEDRTLAFLTAKVADLQAENARLQANFDWLSLHVNTLTMERATLFDKVLGVTFPAVPIIARELPGTDGNYQGPEPSHTRPNPALGDILAKARELQSQVGRPETVDFVGGGVDFEDMGDEAARRYGIHHHPDGTVSR